MNAPKPIVNMRRADPQDVREILHISQLAHRARLLRDMLKGKATDLTRDPALLAAFNRGRLSTEDAIKLAPKQQTTDAAQAASDRRSADDRDYNPHSKSKLRQLGYIPTSVYMSLPELWGNPEAVKRFLNLHPEYRVSRTRV